MAKETTTAHGFTPRNRNQNCFSDERSNGMNRESKSSRLAILSRRALLAAPSILCAQGFPDLAFFFRAFSRKDAEASSALAELEKSWSNSYAVMLLELLRILMHDRRQDSASADAVRDRVLHFLAARTRQSFGADLNAWNRWMWSLPENPHPRYAEFKGLVYANIDPRMRNFFPPGVKHEIRLDQVQWGGVTVNGIPPLVNPNTIAASEAAYLDDSNVIFGIEIGGDARAYPKRILAWHEMARDRIGGVDLAIVYCTLCGTVIPYRATTGGRTFVLGTSGFLYESSKLMFDEETKSLWPALQGRPIIGPLTGAGIQLEFAPVVTTTWREWREAYPKTTVLTLDTGHNRDYAEGAAYREYFGTGRLMFEVSRHDKRLRNKDEILAIRLPGKKPLAIAVNLLRKRRDFAYTHEGVALSIQTSKSGASIVRAAGKRIPAHQAFWFGWYAQFPDTALVK